MDALVQNLIEAIGPALAVLLTAVLSGATVWIANWWKVQNAKLEAQRQAALGAVCEVEAMVRPRVELDRQGKHAHARERIALRLPAGVRPPEQQIDALIVEAVRSEKRMPTSDPPTRDSSTVDTVPDHARRKHTRN